jgi:hypothetical protein
VVARDGSPYTDPVYIPDAYSERSRVYVIPDPWKAYNIGGIRTIRVADMLVPLAVGAGASKERMPYRLWQVVSSTFTGDPSALVFTAFVIMKEKINDLTKL